MEEAPVPGEHLGKRRILVKCKSLMLRLTARNSTGQLTHVRSIKRGRSLYELLDSQLERGMVTGEKVPRPSACTCGLCFIVDQCLLSPCPSLLRWSPSLCHWLSMMPTRGSRYPRTSTLTSTTSTSALSLRSRVPSPSTPTTAVAHSKLAPVAWSPRTNGRHCHSR